MEYVNVMSMAVRQNKTFNWLTDDETDDEIIMWLRSYQSNQCRSDAFHPDSLTVLLLVYLSITDSYRALYLTDCSHEYM